MLFKMFKKHETFLGFLNNHVLCRSCCIIDNWIFRLRIEAFSSLHPSGLQIK